MTCNDQSSIRLNLVNLTLGRKDAVKACPVRSLHEGTGCFFLFLTHGLYQSLTEKRRIKSDVSSFFIDASGKAAPVSWKHIINSINIMANYYCEYCGQKFSSVQSLTGMSCSRHPNGFCKGKHKLYEGREESKYICEYCGQTFSSIQNMTGSSCGRHPNGFCKGNHRPFIGGIKQNYTCKYCGQSFSSLQTLTGMSCSRHPNGFCKGKHSPAI